MPAIRWDISVVGKNAVHSALASIEQRVAQHNARIKALTGGVGGGKFAAASGLSGRASAEQNAFARTSLAQKKVDEKHAAAKQKVIERQSRDANKAEQRQRKIEDKRASNEQKLFDAKAREAAKADAKQAKLAEQRQLYERKIYDRRMREDEKIARKTMAERVRSERASSSAFKRSIGVAEHGALKGAKAVGTAGLAAAGLAGGALYSSSIGSQISATKLASQLANQANRPEMKGDILQASSKFAGFTREEALAGISAHVSKSGSLDDAMAQMRELLQVALATGTNPEDMGQTAGFMDAALSKIIKDPNQRKEVTLRLSRAAAGMGNIGTVEMPDMAKLAGKIIGGAQRYSGELEQSILSGFALAQVAGGVSGSPEEAVLGFARIQSDLITHEKELRAAGVDLYTDKSRRYMRPSEEIIADTIVKTGGDLSKVNAIFGERSDRAIGPLQQIYANAEGKQKGTGRQALLAELARFKGATLTKEQTAQQFASRLADPDIELKESLKQLQTEIGPKLVPLIQRLASEMVRLSPEIISVTNALTGLANWAISNPLEAALLTVVGSIGKSLAGDAISKTIAEGLSKSMAQVAGGAGITIGLAYLAIEQVADARDKAVTETVRQSIVGENIRSKAAAEMRANGGKMSAATAEALRNDIMRTTSTINAGGISSPSFGGAAGTAAMGAFGPIGLIFGTLANSPISRELGGFVGDITGIGKTTDQLQMEQRAQEQSPELLRDAQRNAQLLSAAGEKLGAAAEALERASSTVGASSPFGRLNVTSTPSPVTGTR